jgi:predicted Rossmann fold nucleotide-binding protein DprA/Smf involved in DNA uptake
MKTAIIGSRSIEDYALLLQAIEGMTITEVISGGAAGVDKMAERYAKEQGLPLTIIRPDWRKGKEAGPMRNQKIVELADQVLALWDGRSKGTTDTIRRTKKAGKPLKVLQIATKGQMQLF